jgi:quinol-cytochrome oxidoreductase complex cytochrome b subunit
MKLKEKITKSKIWRSIFRHSYEDTPRNRYLQVISNIFLHLHPTKIPKHALKVRFTFCLGGITFFLFIVEVITGILLMFYYRPVPQYAYQDMKALIYDVPFGMFLRNMHRWAAHLMVVTVILHMFRVFLTGSYKPPREFNWVIGVSLLFVTLLLSFTGYLLPWDQLAYWAVTVATNMVGAAPFIGHQGPFKELLGVTEANDLRALLLGNSSVGGTALLRFYAMHVIGLPLIAGILMAVHFWRVRKDGGISRPL